MDSRPHLSLVLVVTATAVLAFAVLPLSAWGHARLLRSTPSPGSTVSSVPKTVRLWFNEELDVRRSTVSVWDAQGKRRDNAKGGVDLNDMDRASMVATLKPIAAGTYTVRWRAVSADDLNVAQGRFHFILKSTR